MVAVVWEEVVKQDVEGGEETQGGESGGVGRGEVGVVVRAWGPLELEVKEACAGVEHQDGHAEDSGQTQTPSDGGPP